MILWKIKLFWFQKSWNAFILKKIFENYFDSNVCHASIGSTSYIKNACTTSSSIIENDICMLKKSVDCLVFTLSQCAMNHTRLESMFRKKHAPHIYAHESRHTHVYHAHIYDSMYANAVSYTHLTLPTIYSV